MGYFTKDNLELVGLLSGWAVAIWQWNKNRKSEAQLELIRHRKVGPLLVANNIAWSKRTVRNNLSTRPGEIVGVVRVTHNEMVSEDAPLGTKVELVIDNTGARVIDVSTEVMPADYQVVMTKSTLEVAENQVRVRYPYDPQKREQAVILRIKYLADGHRDEQRYQFRHGFADIKLISPT